MPIDATRHLSPNLRNTFNSLPEEEQAAIEEMLDETGQVIYALYDESLRKKLVVDYQNCTWSLEELLNRDFEPVIANKLLAEFNKVLQNPEYCYDDNHRYAEVGNVQQEAWYKKFRKKGCCGFYDDVVTIEGRKFKIGFNYGH
jgi:hypothetical protein